MFGRKPEHSFDNREEGLEKIKDQMVSIANNTNLQSSGFERSSVQDDAPWNILQVLLKNYFKISWPEYERNNSKAVRALEDEGVTPSSLAKHLIKLIETQDKEELSVELEYLAHKLGDETVAKIIHDGTSKIWNS